MILRLDQATLQVFNDQSIRGRLMQTRLLVDAGFPPPSPDDLEFQALVKAWRLLEFLLCPLCDSPVSAWYDVRDLSWEMACSKCGFGHVFPDYARVERHGGEAELLAVVRAELERADGAAAVG